MRLLPRGNFKISGKDGFTLVELLVTLSIIVLFTVGAVTYNRSTEFQIAQYAEQGKIISAIYRARSLAISTYTRSENNTDVPCGYGVYIPSPGSNNEKVRKLIIFKDLPLPNGSCPSYSFATGQNIYDGSQENFEVIELEDIYIESTSDTILFLPPDPQVYISGSSFPVGITIHSPRISGNLKVIINQFGQITYE